MPTKKTAVEKIATKTTEPKAIPALVIQSNALKITSPKDMEKATGILSELNTLAKQLKTEREKITEPLNEALEEVRGRYRPAETALKTAIESVRSMIIKYQTEQERIAQIEKDKIAARVSKGTLGIEKATEKMQAVQEPKAKIATSTGKISFKTVPKFEVVDIKKVPLKYLIANEAEIKKAMIAGFEIEGVRYFTEQVPINRTF